MALVPSSSWPMIWTSTVGIDLVAMCVNDVLTCGAEPLFFLDYVATGKLEPQQLVQVVEGIAKGCELSGCALLGGETAEMPGFYKPNEYDLAGFCVGIVEERNLLNGDRIQVGDVAIGLASSGVHSNGFSLVRKIVSDGGFSWGDRPTLFNGQSLGEVFLTPTQIYVKTILAALKSDLEIHGMAHITGGGLPENLPRCLRGDQAIAIDPTTWPTLPVFEWLAQAGNVKPVDMFNTFNMGIGFVVMVPAAHSEKAISWFVNQHINAYAIGNVISGNQTLTGLP
jgi:phosphoribosylformylglycinamidine cyclo-ligase